jgi:hypothetical protein
MFINENWKELQNNLERNCKTLKTTKLKKEKEKKTWQEYLVWHLGVE